MLVNPQGFGGETPMCKFHSHEKAQTKQERQKERKRNTKKHVLPKRREGKQEGIRRSLFLNQGCPDYQYSTRYL